jgi:hypothetical protein
MKMDYVSQTMLTCIGNKRKLVSSIRGIMDEVRGLLSKEKQDPKAIIYSKGLFKTSLTFNIGALTIIGILIVLYSWFW